MAAKRILVVEDEPDIRLVVVELLREEGYDVAAAEDGERALRQLRTGPRPDLILLDMMMPIMDGPQFRRAQRADPALADVPVLIFSAYVDIAAMVRELSAAGGLRKPVDADELLDAVAKHA